MLAILLGLFRLIWLFGRGHYAVVLENLALRQQLVIFKRTFLFLFFLGGLFSKEDIGSHLDVPKPDLIPDSSIWNLL